MSFRKAGIILTILFLIMTVPPSHALTGSESSGIENKFEPWLWDEIVELETSEASRIISLIIVLTENQSNTSLDIKTLKNNAASLIIERHGASDMYIASVLPFLMAKVNSTEVKTIAAYDFVELLGDGERTGEWTLDVSTKTVRASYIWTNYDYNGSDRIIAILDSGINETHQGLVDKIIDHIDYTGTGFGDSANHGTHCAGIAAGTGAGSPTGRLYSGVALGASLLNVKVGTTSPVAQFVVQGINWAVQHGADIISLSLSLGPSDDCGQCTTCAAIERAVESGVVIAVAAGNFGNLGPGSVPCPGCCEAAITIGATDDFNTESTNNDQLWPWSGRGPVDSRIKPDVVAPGVGIMSPNSAGGYSIFTGSSAAAPHVAGVAALLLQAHPGWTPSIVKSVIMGTARLNDNLQTEQEKENARGKGIVDAERALTYPIDIPTDDADEEPEDGNGVYVAEAYLNGTYAVAAAATGLILTSWADAVLYKSYTPEKVMVNPVFYFGFHDIGGLLVAIGSAYFDAKLKLWDGENELFAYQKRIHTLNVAGSYTTDCFHTLRYQYDGVLLAGHTYNIEYGFYAYATTYLIGIVSSAAFTVQASSLTVMSILNPGNPSFEQRLQLAPGVYGEPYWSINNEGWRNVRGDLDGDGDCDGFDLTIFLEIYHGEYDWKADFNGDGKVDSWDYTIFADSYNKDVPCHLDGVYSWYTSGGGDYAITQWLCDFDVNALKCKQVTFTFCFRPDSDFPDWQQNYAQAEILYVYDGNEGLEQSSPVYPTEETWYSVSVTATLPTNTEAIQVIIRGGPNFHAWIDQAILLILP